MRLKSSRSLRIIGGGAYFGGMAVIVWFTFHYYGHIPGPGKAIAVLGSAAVLMAVRGDLMGHPEKVVWILVVFALLYVEIRTIDKDRQDNQAQHKATRKEEADRFDQILKSNRDGIAAILDDQRNKSAATMQEFALSQARTEKQFSATMSEFTEAISTETGGDSFCYIDAANLYQENAALALITKVGKYPLRSITVWVDDVQMIDKVVKEHRADWFTYRSLWERKVYLGDMPAAEWRGGTLDPFRFTGTTRQDYNITFRAINGYWTEDLRLRKVKSRWTRALRVMIESNIKPKIVLEKIPPDYPLENGKVNWSDKE